MSKIIAIRHGLSTANDHNNKGTPAYGHPDAALMPLGREQAATIPEELARRFGLVAATTSVATSRLRRAQETAEVAGFKSTRAYAVLDEVLREALEGVDFRAEIAAGRIPRGVIAAGERVLASPPREDVWVTHGLVIVGISAALGQRNITIPKFCEMREFNLG